MHLGSWKRRLRKFKRKKFCAYKILFAGVIISTDGHDYPIEKIMEIFDATKCRALMRKPKIFFIQACQGDEKLAGMLMNVPGLSHLTYQPIFAAPSSVTPAGPGAVEADNWPTTVTKIKSCDKFTDFFTFNSSIPGTASFRHPQEGMPFFWEFPHSILKR